MMICVIICHKCPKFPLVGCFMKGLVVFFARGNDDRWYTTPAPLNRRTILRTTMKYTDILGIPFTQYWFKMV